MALPPDTQVIDADVLVIGGGFAGAWASLRAAEKGARVVLVDKAHVGRSGCSTMSGGVTTAPFDGEDVTPWAKEFITHGGYMCDQERTFALLEGQRERVKDLVRWGVPIARDDDGRIRRFVSRGMVDVRCLQFTPPAAMQILRREALARGARILDRVFIEELLTSDGEYPTKGSVIGAVGFHVRDGRPFVFRAKQTIVATGPLSMKGTHIVDNDTGDGFALAYRAGARIVDLEFGFGGTFSYLMKDHSIGGYNVALAHGAKLVNARGERFMERYDPVRFERSELNRVVAAFVKEIVDGRGPVFLDFRDCDDSYFNGVSKVRTALDSRVLLSGKVPDPRRFPLPIEPTWGLWNGTRSGVDNDREGRSNIAGLLSAGSCSKNYATGTHGSAGVPTAFCMNTGYWAGEAAARTARDMASPGVAPAAEAIIERMFAPLRRNTGGGVDRIHDALSMMETDVVETIVLNEAKMKDFLAAARHALEEIATARPPDLHELVKLHEARNLAQSCELVYASALDRTESREQFYREDYPLTDDGEWFVWHGVTREPGGGMKFDRVRIPTENVRFRPPQREKHPSALAAIMHGTYDHAVYDRAGA